MSATILITGAGQLGSRYLQGLANCTETLDIYVNDISEQSLQIAKKRWEQVLKTVSQDTVLGMMVPSIQHKVTFFSSFEIIPKKINIAIIATNADVRPQVIKQVATKCDVQFWILEKVLAQSLSALDEIITWTQNSSGAWVNTARRIMVWHRQIFEKMRNESPLAINVTGSLWGLACNGIHYLDLVSWWTGEKLNKIDTSKLDSHRIESKRKGFFEITGRITAYYSGGTRLVLESRLEGSPFKMKVEGQNSVWEIDEIKGVAVCSDGIIITGNNEMQSSMTSKLVDDILAGKNCELPKLSDSVELHRIFLSSLLEHWNNVNSRNDDTLPIT
jgi:hypothetical protein